MESLGPSKGYIGYILGLCRDNGKENGNWGSGGGRGDMVPHLGHSGLIGSKPTDNPKYNYL